jgi:hypothetical protein
VVSFESAQILLVNHILSTGSRFLSGVAALGVGCVP